MTLKTNDLIFLAMDSPDYACLPSDPMRPGVRLDYSQPIQSPWMRGVGQPLASANPSSRPTSMVELAKLWREERNLMSNDAYDAMLETAARQRAAVEAAAALAPLVSDDDLKTILEEIDYVNSSNQNPCDGTCESLQGRTQRIPRSHSATR